MNRLLKYALAVPAFILLPAPGLRADETVGSPKFVERFLDGPSEKADSAAAVSSQASLTLESIVEQACRGGIFIIRQAFDAVDAAGYHYGRNDSLPEVGVVYAPAISIRGGYLFGQEVLTPWQYDRDFTDNYASEYRGSLLSPTRSSFLDTTAEYDSIAFSADKRGNVYPGLLYSMHTTGGFSGDGFLPWRQKGSVDGFLVWFSREPGQNLAEDTELSFSVIGRRFDISDDAARLYPLASQDDNTLGGIFVVPEVTDIGQISFYLYGVAVRTGSQWQMIFPFVDFSKVFDPVQAVTTPAPAVADEKPALQLKRKTLSPLPAPESAAPVSPEAATAPEATTPFPDTVVPESPSTPSLPEEPNFFD